MHLLKYIKGPWEAVRESLITDLETIEAAFNASGVQDLVNFTKVTASTLLGRRSTSDGPVEEITLGAGLQMIGTELSVIGATPGVPVTGSGAGIPGPAGEEGQDSYVPGPVGPIGPVGAVGPPGFEGLEGAEGLMGPPGPIGLGLMGLMGLPGIDGIDGEDGMPGPPGSGSAGVTSMADGTVSAPGWPFTSDTDTGLYRPGANRLGFATGGVEGLEVSSVGQVVSATQFRCSVYNNGTQNVANATNTTLNFDSEDYDVGSCHDNVTNNSRITIPTGGAGVWLMSYFVIYPTTASSTSRLRQAIILKNGAQYGGYYPGQDSETINGSFMSLNFVFQVTVADGDYFEVQAYQVSSITLASGNATRAFANTFAATRLW